MCSVRRSEIKSCPSPSRKACTMTLDPYASLEREAASGESLSTICWYCHLSPVTNSASTTKWAKGRHENCGNNGKRTSSMASRPRESKRVHLSMSILHPCSCCAMAHTPLVARASACNEDRPGGDLKTSCLWFVPEVVAPVLRKMPRGTCSLKLPCELRFEPSLSNESTPKLVLPPLWKLSESHVELGSLWLASKIHAETSRSRAAWNGVVFEFDSFCLRGRFTFIGDRGTWGALHLVFEANTIARKKRRY
mmetsp:Transcript_36010/g.95593  ORF Transcript_36010/g.95593 Transcript_36010/m.95593 type:complete len:251 (+) Transcript_36010:685-1437(+)